MIAFSCQSTQLNDIYRIKVSGGSDSSLGDFSVLLDTVVDAPELLVDTVSPSGVLRSGYCIDQTHIDKYWNTYGGDNTTNTLSPYYTMSLADEYIYLDLIVHIIKLEELILIVHIQLQ